MYLEINNDPSYVIPGQYQFNFSFLKGQSNKLFNLHFFPYFNMHGPLNNGLKYFRFWLRFRRIIKTLGLKKTDLPGNDTPGSHVLSDFVLTRWGNIPWGD